MEKKSLNIFLFSLFGPGKGSPYHTKKSPKKVQTVTNQIPLPPAASHHHNPNRRKSVLVSPWKKKKKKKKKKNAEEIATQKLSSQTFSQLWKQKLM
jgi:hypothetical protein